MEIKPEAVDPDDVELLQDLVLMATNDALTQAEKANDQTMGQFTKGLNIPGFNQWRLEHALSRTDCTIDGQFYEAAGDWCEDGCTTCLLLHGYA